MKELPSEKILRIQSLMGEITELQRKKRREGMPERRSSRRCETCIYVEHEEGDRSVGIQEAWFCTAWRQIGTHPAPRIEVIPSMAIAYIDIQDPQCPDGMLCASYEPDLVQEERWEREEDFMQQLWEEKMMEDAQNAMRDAEVFWLVPTEE